MQEIFRSIVLEPEKTDQEEKPKRNPRRNARAGHGWEREIILDFKKVGFHEDLTSTRAESRSKDAQGIDLTYKNEHIHGRFPYNIQAKNETKLVSYHDLHNYIVSIPGIINVICHKFTTGIVTKQKKDKKTGELIGKTKRLFQHKGKYAILKYVDFVFIAGELLRLQKRVQELENQLKIKK